MSHTGLDQLAAVVERVASGNSLSVDVGQCRRETARVQQRFDVGVGGTDETHALPLAVDHQAQRDRLHPARGQPGHDLLPQHRRYLVAVEPVKNAAGLLGVNEVLVQVASVLQCPTDRLRRDLVEHHATHRDLGLEHLHQVPGDGLALAVLVSGQQEFVSVGQFVLEFLDPGALVRVHHIDRCEVVGDVHPEPRPRLGLVLGGDVGGLVRQIADVPH